MNLLLYSAKHFQMFKKQVNEDFSGLQLIYALNMNKTTQWKTNKPYSVNMCAGNKMLQSTTGCNGMKQKNSFEIKHFICVSEIHITFTISR